MDIKKCFATILFLSVFLHMKATGLLSDVIYIDGERWELMEKPINADSILYARLMNFLPKNHCVTTANWEGYTAFWEIRDGYLYLQRMEVCVYDKISEKESTLVFHADTLKELFAPYYKRKKICARWFSGELRAGQGDLVRYMHIGFNRNMETEQVMTIKHGKVLESNIYHNYRTTGWNLSKAQDEITKRFPWKQFPEYKGQQLMFSISNFQIAPDGRLSDFNVNDFFIYPMKKEIEDSNHPLVKAFKEALESMYPWEVLFINGKYTVEYESYLMQIKNPL